MRQTTAVAISDYGDAMKIIMVDNFGRGGEQLGRDDVLVASGITNKRFAQTMLDALIEAHSGERSPVFFRLASSVAFIESLLAERVDGQRIRLEAAREGVQRAVAFLAAAAARAKIAALSPEKAAQVLRDLRDSLDADVLRPDYPAEAVDAELRAAGERGRLDRSATNLTTYANSERLPCSATARTAVEARRGPTVRTVDNAGAIPAVVTGSVGSPGSDDPRNVTEPGGSRRRPDPRVEVAHDAKPEVGTPSAAARDAVPHPAPSPTCGGGPIPQE